MTIQLQNLGLESLVELLLAHPSVDSAALYGSVARGDFEIHSDIDVMLVCAASRKLPVFDSICDTLVGSFDRLSLTIYSERELKFLDSVRSLFLLHLSREANILFDKKGFLKRLLSDFRPKRSYRADFDKCLNLLDPLRVVVEDSPNNLHRLSYIYSLFRVFGVYLLAETGVYEFSKSRMVTSLVDTFPGARPSVERLSKLRTLNSNFFTGGETLADGDEPKDSLDEAMTALASLVQVSPNLTLMPFSEAVDEFQAAVGDRKRALDYRLRMWFLLLVYDGLNLYCSRVGRKPLRNYTTAALRTLAEGNTAQQISRAVSEVVHYLNRYPLKYFLSDETKISAERARNTLHGLSNELDRL